MSDALLIGGKRRAFTIYTSVTDTEIRRHSGGDVRQLRDPRFPELRFRYSTIDRRRGAWHVVVCGKWSKAGDYPGIDARTMQATLPAILARRAVDSAATSTVSGWRTVGDLLAWYAARMAKDRGLSDKRKASASSALRCHLVPRLGDVLLAEVDRATVDVRLTWPLQERHALSFVRSVFGVLAVAFRQAHRLHLIDTNPMAQLKFGDLVQTRIKPKAARLRVDDLPDLLRTLALTFDTSPLASMLPLMMLCHGTRLGETRAARWKYINLDTGTWFIPAEDTKTKQEHVLPLTVQACALLSRYRARQIEQGYTREWVFPGPQRVPINANKASLIFVELSGRQWTSHDLRKVARTAWMDLGIDYLVGELLVNHAMKDLDATYIHTTAEALKREALEKWHARLDGLGFDLLHGETNSRQPSHEQSATGHDAQGL